MDGWMRINQRDKHILSYVNTKSVFRVLVIPYFNVKIIHIGSGVKV